MPTWYCFETIQLARKFSKKSMSTHFRPKNCHGPWHIWAHGMEQKRMNCQRRSSCRSASKCRSSEGQQASPEGLDPKSCPEIWGRRQSVLRHARHFRDGWSNQEGIVPDLARRREFPSSQGSTQNIGAEDHVSGEEAPPPPKGT